MDSGLRELVRIRAGACCEYCRLPEDTPELRFHVEHITSRQHGGGDESENLALSCDRCNLHKGPNLASIDPGTTELVRLFHPRRDDWAQHFAVRAGEIVGLTPIGRATVRLLEMNSPGRLKVRRALIKAGLW